MKKLLIVTAFVSLCLCGCDNVMSRKIGGNSDYHLKPGQELVNATWDKNNLWLLVRDKTKNPPVYIFQESSNWGILEGSITIHEHEQK